MCDIFSHWSVDGEFHILLIMWIVVYQLTWLCKYANLEAFWYTATSVVAGSYGTFVFSLLRTSILIVIVDGLLYIHTSSESPLEELTETAFLPMKLLPDRYSVLEDWHMWRFGGQGSCPDPGCSALQRSGGDGVLVPSPASVKEASERPFSMEWTAAYSNYYNPPSVTPFTHGQLWSENIKWKFPEINNS